MVQPGPSIAVGSIGSRAVWAGPVRSGLAGLGWEIAWGQFEVGRLVGPSCFESGQGVGWFELGVWLDRTAQRQVGLGWIGLNQTASTLVGFSAPACFGVGMDYIRWLTLVPGAAHG